MSCMEVLVRVSWRGELEERARENPGLGDRSPSATNTA